MSKKSSLKVGKVQTHLEDVLLPMGLNLTSVDLVGQGVSIELHPFAINVDHKADFTAKLKLTDLGGFLTAKAPGGLKNVRVSAVGDQLLVEAIYPFLVGVPVKAHCRLRIHKGSEIHVDLTAVDMIGSGMKNVIQPQLEKINPVLDADDFPFHATFDRIEIETSHITVEGKMSPKG